MSGGECALLTTRMSHLTLISKKALFDSTLPSRFWCVIDGMVGWFDADVASEQSSASHCQLEGVVE